VLLTKKSLMRAALIGLTPLLASACSTVAEPAHPVQSATGSSDINPQPRALLQTGGTLRLSLQQWITQYNVAHIDGTLADGVNIVSMTEPQLWYYDDNGVPNANPDVLVSADVTATVPKQVVTYRLNPRAIWSDGSPVIWHDFAVQWLTRNGSDQRFRAASTTGYDAISSVEKGADDRVVKVTFGKPYAAWQSLFQPLLPAKTLDTPEKFNTGWAEKIPIWGGPWKVGSLDKSAQTVTLVPNETYWGTRPLLNSIVFRVLDAPAVTDAYANNEIDVAPARLADAYRRLAGGVDTSIRVGGRWDLTQLILGSKGALADLRVRQAIGSAIDRQAVAKAQSAGVPFAIHAVGNHFFMPSQRGYRDNSGEYGRFDLAHARTLLDQAGWTASPDGGTRSKAGAPLKLSYVIGSSSQSDLPQLLQNMLAQVGIAVELHKVPSAEFFSQYVNTGNFDLVSFRTVDEMFPSQLFPSYLSKGELNFGKVGTPQIDTLLESAGGETDQAKAVELINQADAMLWQQAGVITLFQTPQVMAVRSRLANFGAFGLRDNHQCVDVGWRKDRSK
jgi:peptide/nickel transport system substrate-binding protein